MCVKVQIRHISSFTSKEHLFQLKFAAKEMERNSKRCEKEEKAEKMKLKKVKQKLIAQIISVSLKCFQV